MLSPFNVVVVEQESHDEREIEDEHDDYSEWGNLDPVGSDGSDLGIGNLTDKSGDPRHEGGKWIGWTCRSNFVCRSRSNSRASEMEALGTNLALSVVH